MIKRIYVEKKPPFAAEAQALLADLNAFVAEGRLTGLRVLNRYDVENLGGRAYDQALAFVFSEPATDWVHRGEFPKSPTEQALAVEYLPGQYNQRADSARQCLQILTRADFPMATAKVYVLDGDLPEALLRRLAAYLINPVDSRAASQALPETLRETWPEPPEVEILRDFPGFSDQDLAAFCQDRALAMSPADLKTARDYFAQKGRPPTLTEIRALDTYWSDHCRHTTFLTEITDVTLPSGLYSLAVHDAYGQYINLRDRDKPVTLMDLATLGGRAAHREGALPDLDLSPEINACTIRVTAQVNGRPEDWLVLFKNETHNHPTEIEPFGGAATCLGGAVRDPLSGRAYVYQAARVTGGGDPRAPLGDTLPGKLPQKKITLDAAAGFSAYGNQLGLATGLVEEVYHPGFVAKRMEIGAVVGAAPAAWVRREAPAPGDRVILAGGRTGRDGCGGATGSSKGHDEQSLATCGAEVQKGNPVTERKLQRLFRKPEATALVKRCNDFGAGGVCVAVGELAEGLDINLDLVPKKYAGLDGTELAISESQERMALVVAPGDVDRFLALCREENLEAAVIAEVTGDRTLRMRWRGKTLVEIDRDFLDANGAPRQARAVLTVPEGPPAPETAGPQPRAWLARLARPDICSRQGLGERFDSTIGGGTVLMPYGGASLRSPAQVSVCKLPVPEGETTTVTILAHGYDPQVSQWNPFHGAVYAILEAVAKVVAAGGDFTKARLSLQEYFERLGEDPEQWGKPFAALLGALYAQRMTGVPAIGGKDSMSGSFKDLHVPPVVAAFALCPGDARRILTPDFQRPGRRVVLCSPLRGKGVFGCEFPNGHRLRFLYRSLGELIAQGRVTAARAVTGGGVCEAISKLCFGNGIGFRFETALPPAVLYGPGYGGLVLELAEDAGPGLFLDLPCEPLGRTCPEKVIEIDGVEIPLEDCLRAWGGTLEGVFPTRPAEGGPQAPGQAPTAPERVSAPAQGGTARRGGRAKGFSGKPRVLIPVFPGTNGETDLARAFRRAGAVTEELVFHNLTPQGVAESLCRLERALGACQILGLPGGFSAGDEPDGAAKFIAVVLRSQGVAEAVTDLLERRDGLILGICNGFQALVKVGLLPGGVLGDLGPRAPTLTHNTIGRHISRVAFTRVVSVQSPWMAGVQVGDIHGVAISHGEGRFAAEEAELDRLFAQGQVAAVYWGDNPNGAQGAVEALTSPCGRVLGKMGHSERTGDWLYKNVPGNFDQKIFESGVNYFV